MLGDWWFGTSFGSHQFGCFAACPTGLRIIGRAGMKHHGTQQSQQKFVVNQQSLRIVISVSSHQVCLLVAARAEVEGAAKLLAVDVGLLDAGRVRQPAPEDNVRRSDFPSYCVAHTFPHKFIADAASYAQSMKEPMHALR